MPRNKAPLVEVDHALVRGTGAAFQHHYVCSSRHRAIGIQVPHQSLVRLIECQQGKAGAIEVGLSCADDLCRGANLVRVEWIEWVSHARLNRGVIWHCRLHSLLIFSDRRDHRFCCV
jgi:hypothetical protein